MPNEAHSGRSDLSNCRCCPRECEVDRTRTATGWCRTGERPLVSSVCAHRGEEPAVSGTHGICNVFFAHCNLQCIYCQNHQISRNRSDGLWLEDIADIVREIERVLATGARGVGFVSPSHFVPQMREIIAQLRERGHDQRYVFNSNGYDKVETLQTLEGTIDSYLPDLKYMDERLAREYSGAPGYPDIATAALREMFRQKGANVFVDDDGYIESGMIIRHLVLPGHVDNSKAVLRWIAEELSPAVHVSLMSQYYPTPAVNGHPQLGRTLRPEEYEEVVAEFERLGFYRGWVQELGSDHSYRPDFELDHPFEPDSAS